MSVFVHASSAIAKSHGWFSRRHPSADAHAEARNAYFDKVAAKVARGHAQNERVADKHAAAARRIAARKAV